MEIEYIILGLLSLGPRSGYDIKKEMSQSRIFYWSGNSNQIYRGLLKLSEKELVQSEIVQPETGPSKKVFEITKLGKEKIRLWLRSEIAAPEIRNAFLMRLRFAPNLNAKEIDELLLGYNEQLRLQLKILEESKARNHECEMSPGERTISEAIAEYHNLMLKTELTWLRRLRSQLT